MRFPWRYSLSKSVIGVALMPLSITAADIQPKPSIDFSHAGYGGGGVPLPAVAARVLVFPSGADDSRQLQAAIDEVSGFPLGPDGFRGAVQLAPGVFRVADQLRLHTGGVVLRGGVVADATTTIIATGQHRRSLVQLGGRDDRTFGEPRQVGAETVLPGSVQLPLEDVNGLSVGARVSVLRPSTPAWLMGLDMATPTKNYERALEWVPSSRDIEWSRRIAAIDLDKHVIQLDAPITTALEHHLGGGVVRSTTWSGLLKNAGIEDLTLVSDYDRSRPRDEDHAWIAITIDRAEDIWVRRVTTRHFTSSAVWVGSDARRVTITDCHATEPVSEPAGYRRLSFYVSGQQVLVLRCSAEEGWNDFAVGLRAAGPNVFLDCKAERARGDSGSFESWASGTLYENVTIDGAGLTLLKEFGRSQGAGWTAANSILWNCQADRLRVDAPPGAENEILTDSRSLYRSQLSLRCGPEGILALDPNPSGSAEADEFKYTVPAPVSESFAPPLLKTVNGRFVIGDQVVWGSTLGSAWWKGQIISETARRFGFSLTRFAPGRFGRGMTEDLQVLADEMRESGVSFFQYWPGLWYDRRQDDHSKEPRGSSNVWPPFFEMPWIRSGRGVARDNLSEYDLTQFNPWYFDRLREFAALCDERGLILYHNFYNHHNFQESLAHWMDFPWRQMNCIQDTGIPEPRPEEWAKGRFHIANTFYDISDSRRRTLHRAYIEHGLDQLKDFTNVIHSVGFQYSGPLAFQQFFIDTVAEWGRAHNRTVKVALATSKNVTDAILADPVRAPIVSVIDIRYWQYVPDGSLFAPAGGQNLAFREMTRAEFGHDAADTPPYASPFQTYRLVREYRDRYPDKVIVAYSSGNGPIPVLMAGAAQSIVATNGGFDSIDDAAVESPLNSLVNRHLARELPAMLPLDGLLAEPEQNWCLAEPGRHYLIYSVAGDAINFLDSLPKVTYDAFWFDPRTGRTRPTIVPANGFGAGTKLLKPSNEAWLLFLKKK